MTTPPTLRFDSLMIINFYVHSKLLTPVSFSVSLISGIKKNKNTVVSLKKTDVGSVAISWVRNKKSTII